MKYKVLLILNDYNKEIIARLDDNYNVECLNQEFVNKASKKNVKYIDYHIYTNKYDSMDQLVEILDKYRDYSFILSDTKINNKKYYDVNNFIVTNNIPSKYSKKKLNLLVSGHDLKFIKDLFLLFQKEYNIEIIENEDYLIIDKEKCKEALKKADIIWCEWLLENAYWFSHNIYPFQRLIIRAHRFEVYKNYGYKLNLDNVEKIITVGYFYYEEFIKKFNLPRNKVTVIPNFIDTKKYSCSKNKDYKYNIALIGALPMRKGLAHAVKILFELKKVNMNYKLHILGLKPENLTSTKFDRVEAKYYEDILNDIKLFNLEDDVIFTGWVDVKKYLQNIGYVLSVSDNEKPESFHITPAEGLVSGCVSLATYWQGIEYIYPEYVIKKNINEIVETILELEHNDKKYQKLANKGKEFIIDNYDIEIVYKYILKVLEG